VLHKKPYLLTYILVLFLFLFSVELHAKKAEIKDIMITNDPVHLLLYARMSNCFTEDIEAAVLAGVPTTFTFSVDLFKERSWRWDENLISLKIQHTIKYDNVKKIFNVSIDGQKNWVNFSGFNNAKQMMADINAFPVTILKNLDKNNHYYVKLKGQLRKVRLPFHLEYLFFFVSLWDIETDWYIERFFY
jgi:hypothetical protein